MCKTQKPASCVLGEQMKVPESAVGFLMWNEKHTAACGGWHRDVVAPPCHYPPGEVRSAQLLDVFYSKMAELVSSCNSYAEKE